MNRMIAITISPGAVTAEARSRRHEHQEERPEQLREQTPPLLARIVEVLDRVDHISVEPLLEPSSCAARAKRVLIHCRPLTPPR